MSSYHLLNAVWIGVFPMLAVTVLLGVICYIVCCLNRIKIRCVHCWRKRNKKKLKLKIAKNLDPELAFHSDRSKKKKTKKENSKQDREAKPPLLKKKNHEDHSDIDDDLNTEYNPPHNGEVLHTQSLNTMLLQKPPPLPLTVPPQTAKQIPNSNFNQSFHQEPAKYDRTSLKLNLKHSHSPEVAFKPKSILQTRSKPDFIINELDEEPNFKFGIPSSIRSSKSLNTVDQENLYHNRQNKSNGNIEQLIVQELKESPKGIHARFKYLPRKETRKPSIEPPIIANMDRSPNSALRFNFTFPKEPSNPIKRTVTSNAPFGNTRITKCTNQLIDDKTSMESNNDHSRTNSSDSDTPYDGKSSSEESSNMSESFNQKRPAFSNLIKTNGQKRNNFKKKNKKNGISTTSSNSALDYKSNKNNLIKKADLKRKNLIHTNNFIISDIEIEDALIFNDDNDSLSSAGVCTEHLKHNSACGSQITLTNKSLVNLKSKRNLYVDSEYEQFNVEPFQKESIISKHSEKPSPSNVGDNVAPDYLNSSSVSDIDPDENILRNLLVKNSLKKS